MLARELSENGRAALSYAALGWRVFPIYEPTAVGVCSCSAGSRCGRDCGKHPRTAHGLTDGTTDATQIAAWWGTWPNANVGVCTGDGLAVLDFDTPEALVAFEARFGPLPSTPRSVTGCGFHALFAGDLRSVTKPFGPGLAMDTRGEGGYIVAPPSLHTSGKRYTWEDSPEHVVLAPLPPPVLEALEAGRGRAAARGGMPDISTAIIAGGRNSALTSFAGSMRARGLSERVIYAALRELNDESCRPPLDEKEVSKIAWSVSRYEPVDALPTMGPDEVATSVTGGIDLWTAADMAGDPPLTEYLAPRIHLAPGRPLALTGYAGAGKTMLLADLLLAIASRELQAMTGILSQAWGSVDIARGGPVVHLDLEVGKKGTWSRYKRLAAGRGFDVAELGPLLRWRSYPNFRLNQRGALEVLCKTLDGATACGVDSLKALCPGTKENDSSMADFVGILGEASEKTGAAIVLIHHEGKPGEDGQRVAHLRGRGSSAIQGCLSSQWSVSPRSGFWLLEHGKSEHDELQQPIKVLLQGSEERADDGKSKRLVFCSPSLPEIPSVAEVQAAYDALREELFRVVADWGEQGCAGLMSVAKHMHRRREDLRPAWHELTSGEGARIYNETGLGGSHARWKVRK